MLLNLNAEKLLELVKLSEDVYLRAKDLEKQYGRKIYEGLMLTVDFKGSSEAAAKMIELQRIYSIPMVYLESDNVWAINKDLVTSLIKYIDPRSPVEKIIKETNPEPTKFVGKVRLKLGGAWGEISSFYILNEPLPKLTNVIYILHIATYVTSFSTVTIPEIYTGSEEFLKLVSNVDKKDGAIEFLTKLMRKRYIPEDLYTAAIEAVNKRNDLTFTSLRDILDRIEARRIVSESFVFGVTGIANKLSELLSKYGDKSVPREDVAVIVGEVYSITRGLKEAYEEFEKALNILNDLMTTSGKQIPPSKLRNVIEQLSRV